MAESLLDRVALTPQALNPRSRSTIRRSFFVYTGLLLLIGWMFAAWHVWESRARTVSATGTQLRAVADSLLVQLEAMLSDGLGSAQSALVDLNRVGALVEQPTDAVVAQLRDEVTGDYIRAIFIGSPERTVVTGGDIREEHHGVPAWLTQTPQAGQTIVGRPIADPLRPGHSVIPVARAILDDLNGLVFVGLWFDVEQLLRRYETIDIERGAISIVTADGWMLVGTAMPGRPYPEPADVTATEVFARMTALPAGRAHVLEGTSAIDHKRKLFAVAKLGGGVPLYLVFSRDFQAVLAPWKRDSLTVLWFALGGSGLVIGMTVLLYRFLHEINRRETQFLKLFESSLVSIFLLKDGHIVEKNSRARKAFDVPDHQTLRGRRFEEISAPAQYGNVPTNQAILPHFEALRRNGAAVFQWTFKRTASGESFEAEVHMSTIEVANDVVTLVMIRDISEQERAKRALSEANSELEARVARRTAQLQAANAELRAANLALEEFTGAASHDLRTPLTVISGQAGLLDLTFGELLGPQGRQRLARIQKAVGRASDVITGLLSLSSITRQALEIEPVNLSAIAQEMLDELRDAENDRPAEVDIEPDMVVYADQRLMRSLLGNLIGNAWKYSSKRPQIWIRFSRIADRDGELVYCIADRGAGFDMAHAEKLFQAFRRLHSAQEFSGIGLGLATVQRIVGRYGGRIWAEAEPGAGAKFFFTLPQAQPREDGAKVVGL
jgi:PAS domain S-box-containing protein